MKLREIADNRELLEIARKRVEDVLIEFRDERISILKNNGLVIREKNGQESSIIRLGIEDAVRLGILAIANHLDKQPKR